MEEDNTYFSRSAQNFELKSDQASISDYQFTKNKEGENIK